MLSPIQARPCDESKSCDDAASPRSGISESKESGFETANFEPTETEANLQLEEEIEQMRRRVLGAPDESSCARGKKLLSGEKGKSGEAKRNRTRLQSSD